MGSSESGEEVELGAGPAVPSVRFHCERSGGDLVRINPQDMDVPPGSVAIPLGAREALSRIDALLA